MKISAGFGPAIVTTSIVENGDRISCQNLCAVAAKRDVGDEIELAVAARRVKFQRRISREHAAADIEHAVSPEYAGFEHICVRAGIIECDRSVAVDVGEERSADIITAAINIDRRATDRAVAAKNLKGGIIGDGGTAGNVHVDGRDYRPMLPPVLSI